METPPKLLYTRREAAEALSVGVSTLDLMIHRGMIRSVRKGRRVLVHKNELARAAVKNFPQIWPSKRDRKTARVAATAPETNGAAVPREEQPLVLKPGR
ncbi:MAG: excisionase family DNA-binding protein [Candidatus Acidiferrales bacterium]